MRVHTTPGVGRTEIAVRHLAYLHLGQHKGARRLWLEGRRLSDVGFKAGVRYQVAPTADGALQLRLSATGDHVVSHKQTRPVVDILTHALGDVERVEVRFVRGAILVDVHPLDKAVARRLARLNARLAAHEPLRLGSVCHGGGVAADALLRGLGQAGTPSRLAFGLELERPYLEQSLTRGPLADRGAVSVEGDLGEVDYAALGECDLLEAGLPCVAASPAGRSKKHLARPEADLQVADLAAAFLDVVRATQPLVVLLENVPEYACSASADLIRRRLERWGYVLQERVVEGIQWSLENRRRWILVATTRGLAFDLDNLQATREHATLGEVLDTRVEATRWHTFSHLASKETRDLARGNGFRQQLLDASSTRVPTLRRGYQKGGSTDPRLQHPTRKGMSRLLTPSEHARIKGVPPSLVSGLSDTVAHQVLGQSVIAPAFVGLGQLLGAL
jgi:DNA (cytosine-5)-methyltransferase 1